MRKSVVRVVSCLLAMVMLLGVMPLQAIAELSLFANDDPIIVVAGSDFQAGTHENSAANVTSILSAIKKDYPTAHGFLFGGDYDSSTGDSLTGYNLLLDTVDAMDMGFSHEVYIQGNHDYINGNTLQYYGALSRIGKNDDPDGNYGVFAIHEEYYMGKNRNQALIQQLAGMITSYLTAKGKEGFDKPIFILSHLPLHYSMRTYNVGDARHANLIFDAISNAVDTYDLNVIFLYGHDHSGGYDDYLGGSAVYLTPGDKINIAQSSKYDYTEETLNFTYMNAGFVGYYEDTGNDVDRTLTMTVFEIYKSGVVVKRYDENGVHNLKSAGKYSGMYPDHQYVSPVYSVNSTVRTSPQTINFVELPDDMPDLHDWEEIEDGYKSTWVVANSLTAGKRYIIVNDYQAGNRKAATLNGSAVDSESVTVLHNTAGNYIEYVEDNQIWTYTGGKFVNAANETVYLRGNQGKTGKNLNYLRSTTSSGDSYTSWRLSSSYGLYTTSGYTRAYVGNAFQMKKSGSNYDRVYVFEEVQEATTSTYANWSGVSYITLPVNAFKTSDEILDLVKGTFRLWTATDPLGTNLTQVFDYTFEGTIDPATSGLYYLDVLYKGMKVFTYTVFLVEKKVVNIICNNMVGSASFDSAHTGAVMTVIYSDGYKETMFVTPDMLSGEFDLRVPGTYSNLDIVFKDKTLSGFTLHVYENNYPEFPHEGSIRVNKGGTGIDFLNTGVAKVELATTGVPIKRGADVIIMLDTSSSMKNTIGDASRIDVLNEALGDLVVDLQKDGEDGTPMDIRLAIADFNNYFSSTSSPYYLNSSDRLSGTTSRGGVSSPNVEVYTGDLALGAGAFVDVHDLKVRGSQIYRADGSLMNVTTENGTNYDYAFDAVYQLGHAITKANEEAGEDRDLFVIFMSDGAPFQYNYFSSQSEADNWNDWLQGTLTNNMYSSGANRNYYNEDGKHWMAEAIKGSPDESYRVIRKNNKGLEDVLTATDTTNIYTLPGLGATMFSIGFCLAPDKEIELASMTTVLKNIATDPNLHYYVADTAEDLHNAFHHIGQGINYAATDAYFVDVMGLDFDIQTATVNYEVNGEARSIVPTIKFEMYGLYTLADVEAGLITHDQIGTRNDRMMTVETVTFSADGTKAYSNGGQDNILINGVLHANHFWYNTNDYSVMIDTDLDGVEDYLLANECFYWKLGTINQHDMVLSYYVYLTGSMEGTREAGLYPTNQSAVLYYKNWLGNDAYRETVSPVMPWQEAAVRYAFYLVDENGQPLVNQEMGLTGSFNNRISLTNPQVYSDILLNSSVTLSAAELASKDLPEGYALYDPDATYTISVGSGDGDSGWVIERGNGKGSSTYVTGHNSYLFSNALSESNDEYDYTHTIVWFAVLYTVEPVADTVVVDYGIPVDVDVLFNDMFYGRGGIVAVGPLKTDGNLNGDTSINESFTDADGFRSSYESKYGTVSVVGSKVRYTLRKGSGTNICEPDVVSYAVLYDNRYYYGTLTILPAAHVNYEENFLTYVDSNAAEGILGTWNDVGTVDSNAVQSEDRPGFNNLGDIDVNNIYGYDPAYLTSTTYSNGGGMAITVDENTGSAANAPYATFTFTGTGFDIISLTDNVGGTILVTVTDESGKTVASKSVNNYYGYTYSAENGWQPDADSKDTVWQVPVIKVFGLKKATYTVKIQVIYLTRLDDLYPDKTCTFVMDSIRIYDPGKGNVDVDNAHKVDREYAPYYFCMKDLVLGAAEVAGTDNLPGVVFIDGKDATVDIDDYENPGPNHELYLAIGQGISFKLTATDIPVSAHIGIKMAYGSDGVVKHGVHDFVHVYGSANMYYKMEHLSWSPVLDEEGEILYYESPVITLSHSDRDYFHDTSAVVSFTGFKFTFDKDDQMVQPVVDDETLKESIAVMTQLYAQDDSDMPEDNGNENPENQPGDETTPEGGDTPDQENPSENDTAQPPADEPSTDEPNADEPPVDDQPEDTLEDDQNANETTAPAEKDEATSEPADADSTSKGCSSTASVSALATLLMLVACAFVTRKRR